MEIIDVNAGIPGPAEWFTGDVTLRPIATPGRASILRVHFEPRARTAWHTHPVGQTLHVIEGTARVQSAGGAVTAVPAGETVRFAPGESHWHGAGPDQAMTHIAIQESDDAGSSAAWAEHVSDEQYDG